MNLSISNLAWNESEREEVAILLNQLQINSIDLAPTKIWPAILETKNDQFLIYKKWWAKYNINIVALQSLLFSFPNLTLFGQNQGDTFTHFKNIIKIGHSLGVKRLIYGAPKSRNLNGLSSTQAFGSAVNLFRKLGDFAQSYNIIFCIEPNPSQYKTEFITNSDEGAKLVKTVNSKGFGLHLDISAMYLENEVILDKLAAYSHLIKHFHISAPYLDKIDTLNSTLPYAQAVNFLKKVGYKHTLSIEMLGCKKGSNISSIKNTLSQIQDLI